MYRYAFDNTIVGHWRLSRSSYELVHEGYKTILERIEEWNRLALARGAEESPYLKEAHDLKVRIEWGEEQLQAKERPDIVVTGVSVGSLRYAKAALLYAATVKEEEEDTEAENWPTAVKRAVAEVGRLMRELAGRIEYPPADILAEMTAGGEEDSIGPAAVEWDVFICHASTQKTRRALSRDWLGT